MLEAVSDVFNLFLYELLLLLFNMELPFSVKRECEIIHVFDKLFSNVFKTLEPSSK